MWLILPLSAVNALHRHLLHPQPAFAQFTVGRIGVVTGLATGWVLALIIRTSTSMAASVPLSSVALALASSVVTGILFGIYPAYRAARLDPVAALRHE